MRRAIPVIIILVGLAALVVDFAPNFKIPTFADPNSDLPTTRTIATKLGLDLAGGVSVEYQAQPVGNKAPGPADMDVIRNIIERRVNSTGVTEPLVQTQGSDRVVVELPGETDKEAVEQLVGSTGQLEFIPLPVAQYGTATSPGQYTASEGQPLPYTQGVTALFGGDQVASANPTTDQNGGRAIGFALHDKGSKAFGTYTSQHRGEFFAIVLDGVVVSAPSIDEPITSGSGIIRSGTVGGFPSSEVNRVVTVLRYGSLPFPIKVVQDQVINPTLGSEFLRQALVAGGIGIFLVFAFMLIYYRLPGLIADGALIYYALVVYAIFRLIPVTLTLAGIAGFVLSVGMAVDANILIFERTKEELRLGKSLPTAIEAGFARAWNSIFDSNVSSLITATILYQFGSSTIRGFALVLIIGVLISMFTAITVTRTILRFVVRQDAVRRAWLFGVGEDEFETRPMGRPVRGEARGRV
ncbi:MAG TPA: protein translocase subunit SecD [Candidatus Limnocylindrales bacterium]